MSVDDAEILGDQLFIVQNVTGIAGEHTAPGVEDDRLVRNVERQLNILFDENDGLPFLLQSSDGATDFGDDQARMAFRRLIEQKHPRIAHQRAPDRKHLLFAAGERAGILCVAFTQPWKQGVNPVDVPRCAGCTFALLGHDKVFPDRKRRKHAASLRYETDPEMRDAFGAETFDWFTKQLDFSGPGFEKT